MEILQILLNTQQSFKIDTSYLLDTEVNISNHRGRDIKCELNNCSSLKHIIKILAKYRSYIDTSQNEQSKLSIATNVYNTKQNQYNDINLLNDFNHLLESHRDEFEEIYNMLNHEIYNNNDCRLRECLSMRRHHRDRHKITENEEILNEL